ncbi:hypothetical protein OF83DRAFT_1133317 [Amylostereum chailletii]|nr:hypothetical protein OF83DRAFT_1133317 [Amylostereum chailletii]
MSHVIQWSCAICARTMDVHSRAGHMSGQGHRKALAQAHKSDFWNCSLCLQVVPAALIDAHLRNRIHDSLATDQPSCQVAAAPKTTSCHRIAALMPGVKKSYALVASTTDTGECRCRSCLRRGLLQREGRLYTSFPSREAIFAKGAPSLDISHYRHLLYGVATAPHNPISAKLSPAHWHPDTPLANPMIPWTCLICDRTMDPKFRIGHLVDTPHSNVVEAMAQGQAFAYTAIREPQPKTTWTCTGCHISMTRQNKAAHLAGRHHREMLIEELSWRGEGPSGGPLDNEELSRRGRRQRSAVRRFGRFRRNHSPYDDGFD